MLRRSAFLFLVLVVSGASGASVGCGSNDGAPTDGDASAPPAHDSGMTGNVDSGMTGNVDSGMTSNVDSGMPSDVDSGIDATAPVTDAGMDSAPETDGGDSGPIGDAGNDGGPGTSDAGDAGADGGRALGGLAVVAGGTVSHSAKYTLIGTLGQSPGGSNTSRSANVQLRGGIVGVTQAP